MMAHTTNPDRVAFRVIPSFPESVDLNQRTWRVWRNLPAGGPQVALYKLIMEVMSAKAITRDTPIAFSRFFASFVCGLAGKAEMACLPWYSARSRSPTLEERLRSYMFGTLTHPEIHQDMKVNGRLEVLELGFLIRGVRKNYVSTELLQRSDMSPMDVVKAFVDDMEPILSYIALVRAQRQTSGSPRSVPKSILEKLHDQ